MLGKKSLQSVKWQIKWNLHSVSLILGATYSWKETRGILLTNIKLKALLRERVAASSSPTVLLQDQDFLSNFGQEHRKPKPTDPTANDDGIQVVRYFTGHKTYRKDSKTFKQQRGYSQNGTTVNLRIPEREQIFTG